MKAYVTIPDPIMVKADALAARLGLTRSEIVTLALEQFLDRYGEDHEISDVEFDAEA